MSYKIIKKYTGCTGLAEMEMQCDKVSETSMPLRAKWPDNSSCSRHFRRYVDFLSTERRFRVAFNYKNLISWITYTLVEIGPFGRSAATAFRSEDGSAKISVAMAASWSSWIRAFWIVRCMPNTSRTACNALSIHLWWMYSSDLSSILSSIQCKWKYAEDIKYDKQTFIGWYVFDKRFPCL